MPKRPVGAVVGLAGGAVVSSTPNSDTACGNTDGSAGSMEAHKQRKIHCNLSMEREHDGDLRTPNAMPQLNSVPRERKQQSAKQDRHQKALVT